MARSRRAHSSSGLGHRPLTAAARVRIPYAPLQRSPCSAGAFFVPLPLTAGPTSTVQVEERQQKTDGGCNRPQNGAVLRRITVLGVIAVAMALSGTAGAQRTSTNVQASLTCRGAVSWQRASSLVGRVATIQGRVAGTRYAASTCGSPTFLNWASTTPTDRLGSIWSKPCSVRTPRCGTRSHHLVRGLGQSYRRWRRRAARGFSPPSFALGMSFAAAAGREAAATRGTRARMQLIR